MYRDVPPKQTHPAKVHTILVEGFLRKVLSLGWDFFLHLYKDCTCAKITAPQSFNDFRPVSLTSLVMKAFEKIAKNEILILSLDKLNSLQFAYRAGI